VVKLICSTLGCDVHFIIIPTELPTPEVNLRPGTSIKSERTWTSPKRRQEEEQQPQPQPQPTTLNNTQKPTLNNTISKTPQVSKGPFRLVHPAQFAFRPAEVVSKACDERCCQSFAGPQWR